MKSVVIALKTVRQKNKIAAIKQVYTLNFHQYLNRLAPSMCGQ